MKFSKALSAVHNRGSAPESFIVELATWAALASDDIFARNNNAADIYALLSEKLGPFKSILHRRAVMCEALRVLAGFESSWNWGEGRDVSNPDSDTPSEVEAGPWQVSYNSIAFGPELRSLAKRASVKGPAGFQAAMKKDHQFAMEYTARLLRMTINHHGPLKRGDVSKFVRNDAVSEFESFMSKIQSRNA